jgi:uncharacterized membrane protein YqaE (UPF0057 family)
MKKIFLAIAILMLFSVPAEIKAASIVPASSLPGNFNPELVRSAFNALKNLPHRERKSKLKSALAALREFKKEKKEGKEPDTNTLLLVLLDILLPPLAVYLHEGTVNNKFWITLLLFVLGLAGTFFFSWLLIFAAVVYGLIVILGA